jgi:hypothetical protein
MKTAVSFGALKRNFLKSCFCLTASFFCQGHSFLFTKSLPYLSLPILSTTKNNHTTQKMSMSTITDEDVAKSWKLYRLVDSESIEKDWVKNLELDGAKACLTNAEFLPHGDDGHPPRILLIYGSLRTRSFSKFLCYEFARVLEYLGAECRVYDPRGLPQHDTETHSNHPKVVELRTLSQWSEGQVW